MLRLLFKIVLSALAVTIIFPMISGIDFHGNFASAVGLSVMFAIMLWLVELAAVALSAALAITTLGVALLWLIPLWILGFWLLPAIALMLVANIMPAYLTVSGWGPAIVAGLVMLAIGMVTSKTVWSGCRQD